MKYVHLFTLFLITCAGADSWSTAIRQDDDPMYGIKDCCLISNGNSIISVAGPFADPYLICLGQEGQMLWNRQILETGGSSRAFESGGILLSLEEGFAACFNSEPRATGINTDVAVIRSDSSGEVLWTYILGENDDSVWMCTDIISCSDGGLLITGCPGTMLPGGYVLKLSSDGNPEWMTAPDEITGYAISAVEDGSGDYLLLVEEYMNTVTVQKVSREGEVCEARVVHDSGIQGKSIIRLVEGSIWIISPGEDNSITALRLNSDVEIDKYLEFGFSSDIEILTVEMTEAGIYTAGRSGDDAFLSMTDLNGSNIWQRLLDTGDNEILRQISIGNGSLLACGYLETATDYSSASWILKTDSLGMVEGAEITDSGVQKIETLWIPL